MAGRVAGKVCIVTGAADGLGKADAEALVREGAIVVLTDVDEAKGRETASALGAAASFVRQDVREEEGWRTLVAEVETRFGRLDVLVSNAGVIRRASIEEHSLEDWRFTMAVNVEGTFLGVKHCLPAMRRAGGGSIVLVSSTAVLQGYARAPAYVASKGAIFSLVKSVAMHCMRGGDRIRCNAVLPHNASSPMQREAIEAAFAGVAPEDRPKLDVGPAEAVANAVLFLASDESSELNGTFLNLDRGASLIVGQL